MTYGTSVRRKRVNMKLNKADAMAKKKKKLFTVHRMSESTKANTYYSVFLRNMLEELFTGEILQNGEGLKWAHLSMNSLYV